MNREARYLLSLIPERIYGEVRVVRIINEEIAVKDGVVEALSEDESNGYGVRVLVDGAWGFAASYDFSPAAMSETVRRAVSIAKETARYVGYQVPVPSDVPIQATYKTSYEKDPFTIAVPDKINVLLAADHALRVDDRIITTQAYYAATREQKLFVSTVGSVIDQEITWCRAGIETAAVADGEYQNRSYPNSFRGQSATRGFELVTELDLPGNAPRIGEEACALLTAPVCPSGEYDLILDGNQLALQIHESCGHAVELDRVLGYEASYAGTSFLTPEKLDTFRYGSDIVTLTADATIAGGLGTFGYDDEGVAAQRTELVKNGIFRDYITSRETAARLQTRIPSYNRPSNGTMRAMGWSRIPLIRMTNINLEPGDPETGTGDSWTLDRLIEDTKRGIFMSTNRSWSIDNLRLNFQFGTEVGWEIRNGKKYRMVKNPTYQGMTPQFWGSCDAICGRDEWTVWGTPNCGKGQPSQLMYTGHGASPARFRNVTVGVAKLS